MLHRVKNGESVEAFGLKQNSVRNHITTDNLHAVRAMDAVEDILCNRPLPSAPEVIHESDIKTERCASWRKETNAAANIADACPAWQVEQQAQIEGIARNIDVALHRGYGWRIAVRDPHENRDDNTCSSMEGRVHGSKN